MNIADQIRMASKTALEKLYSLSIEEKGIQINETKPEFEGDYTLVLFSFIKQLKKSPEQLGKEIGDHLINNYPDLFSAYNVIKGFLNLTVKNNYWVEFLQKNYADLNFGKKKNTGNKVMVEYSSPNTNKPLHLGHLRNNFLGWSVAEILKANGSEITKTCIVNDRGIHICKSMIAWQMFGNGETPESTGIKGDHFVGDYYVKFENDLKIQAQPIIDRILKNDLSGFEGNSLDDLKKYTTALQKETNKEKIEKLNDEIKEIARNHTKIMAEAKEM